jgi:hypothetical protein
MSLKTADLGGVKRLGEAGLSCWRWLWLSRRFQLNLLVNPAVIELLNRFEDLVLVGFG